MNSTSYSNKVAWCKFCNQGWLEIKKEIATKKFSIICCECDTEYDTPEDMLCGRNPHLYKGGRCKNPNIKEIIAIGWDSYIIKDWHFDNYPTL